MSTLLRGAIFWTPYILLGELLAVYAPWWPFPTITGTVRALIAAWPPEAILVAIAMIALGGHFESGWRVRYFLAALTLAFAAFGLHLLLKR